MSPLDNPSWSALTGEQARFAEGSGGARRYRADVAPFHSVPADPDATAWRDLARLTGPGALAVLNTNADLPPDWELVQHIPAVQLVDDGITPAPDDEALRLGASDVPEMLDLVARTQPGPFLPRTVELGNYLGVRRGGALVAMAGERMRPDGHTEISAVCTDPAHRGQGLAARLVLAVAVGIAERGETAMMHAAAANTGAIRVYEKLGFAVRRETKFVSVRAPLA
ncbi:MULTISPECIES: GNAT family N-acetyltransferase [Actinosynnema]|uniref:GNAT family N-acetyltransferase n=1 Tax=Actinosynnema TaxID=40566 RepID=UPI0020A2B2A7|nr:GNAT family N-acetyltransferase [Actinosynnema pretiosum]MCP2098202.1 FR47-like protein [Actinosynnema pretiosum]